MLTDFRTLSSARIGGDLTVIGTVSASNYLNLPSLSGGTSSDTLSSVVERGNTTSDSISVGGLDSSYVKFDVDYSPTGSEATGTMYWNDVDRTVDLVNDGSVQQIGQELFIRVRNTSGNTIANGTPVYINGRQGNRPKIYPARSNSHETAMVAGLTTSDIEDGADGFITTFGYVRQIKTNYSGSGVWGTTWEEGDNLYVSKDTAGRLTNVEPPVPHHSDIIGTVAVVGASGIGSILVNIYHHKSLEELCDVNGTVLTTTGQLPVWSSSLSAFDFNYNINDYVLKNTPSFTGTPAFNSTEGVWRTALGIPDPPLAMRQNGLFDVTNTAVVVPIPGITDFPVAANTLYCFEVHFTAASTSGGVRVELTMPSSIYNGAKTSGSGLMSASDSINPAFLKSDTVLYLTARASISSSPGVFSVIAYFQTGTTGGTASIKAAQWQAISGVTLSITNFTAIITKKL